MYACQLPAGANGILYYLIVRVLSSSSFVEVAITTQTEWWPEYSYMRQYVLLYTLLALYPSLFCFPLAVDLWFLGTNPCKCVFTIFNEMFRLAQRIRRNSHQIGRFGWRPLLTAKIGTNRSDRSRHCGLSGRDRPV